MKKIAVKILQNIGKIIGYIFYKGTYSKQIFIFHSHNIGGAEIVHLDILNALNFKPLIIFLAGSKEKGLLNDYKQKSSKIIVLVSNRFLRHLQIGVLKMQIKKSQPNLIFGIATVEFYDIISDLRLNAKFIDILHANEAIKFAPKIIYDKMNFRIVIDPLTDLNLKNRYVEYGYENLLDRIRYIPNTVDIPKNINGKQYDDPLRILFVGRGTYEKRIHIILEAAKEIYIRNSQISFTFIGPDVDDFSSIPENCNFVESTSNRNLLNSYYLKSHVILIVSEREGFPMVIMEGMSFGVVPICTSVGGIPFIIENNSNGLLLKETEENKLIIELYDKILNLDSNRACLERISNCTRNYALNNFSKSNFNEAYLSIFNE